MRDSGRIRIRVRMSVFQSTPLLREREEDALDPQSSGRLKCFVTDVSSVFFLPFFRFFFFAPSLPPTSTHLPPSLSPPPPILCCHQLSHLLSHPLPLFLTSFPHFPYPLFSAPPPLQPSLCPPPPTPCIPPKTSVRSTRLSNSAVRTTSLIGSAIPSISRCLSIASATSVPRAPLSHSLCPTHMQSYIQMS